MTSNRTLVYCLTAMVLACAGTATAQTLSTNPTSLTFAVQPGAFPAAQTLTVSATSPVNFTAAASTAGGGGWLSVVPTSGQAQAPGPAPAIVFVIVSPGSLSAGTYYGTVTFTALGATNSPLPVPVTLNVGPVSTGPLTATPGSLSFTYAAGGQVPPSQNLLVSSATVSQVMFTAAVTTGSGTNWLTINTSGGTTPANIAVGVNPVSLSPGTYGGTITFTPTSGAGGSLPVQVTLTVTGTPQLSATPSAVTFYYQIGQAAPAQKTVALASGGVPVNFVAVPGTPTGGNWLVVSPNAETTPRDLTVAVNPAVLAALPAATYNGLITVTAPQASNSPLSIPVTLIVSTTPFLTASPNPMSFTMPPAGPLPASQNLAVGSTGTALPFAVLSATTTPSGVNWLSVYPAGGITPTTIAVSITSAALTLPPGTYNGSVVVASTIPGIPQETVSVVLTVSSVPGLSLSPPSMVFNYQTGRVPPGFQSVEVKSSGIPVNFMTQVSPASAANWLFISAPSGVTPATITASVNPAGLAVGAHQGSVTFTPAGGGAMQTLPVTLNVSNTPLMNVTPGALAFEFVVGSAVPQYREVALTSTGDPLNYSVTYATTSGGSNWMAVAPVNGTTAANPNLTVFVTAASLPIGVYNGSITVTATNANTQVIPVTVTVTSGVNLSVTPASLSFTQAMGGAAAAAQKLAVTTSGTSVRFTAVATTGLGGGWLTVLPATTSTPAELSVSVDASRLPQPGTYDGSITLVSPEAANSPQTVRVTFVLGPPQTIVVSPPTLQFSFQTGASAPAAQKVTVSSTGGSLNFTAAASMASGSGWLAVSPASGSTSGEVSVSVAPAGLTPATYSGTITVASPSASNSPQSVSVTLTVTAAPRPEPFLAGVANAASYGRAALTVGEIVYLEGTNIGPNTLTTLRVTGGRVDTILADTRILFDGIASPLIYVSSMKSSAVVPYLLAGRASTRVQVEYQSVRSNAVEFRLADAAPGLFSMDASGQGPGAILNQDYSVNGPGNPAPKGSVVMLYGTGEGLVTPPVADGSITPGVPPFASPVLPVSVTIGGRPAQVFYAGPAPNFVAGVLQVNARVPDDIPAGGTVPVIVTVGTASSQAGLTMAVR